MKGLVLLLVSGILAVPLYLSPSLSSWMAAPSNLLIALTLFSFPHFGASYFLFYRESALLRRHPLIAWFLPGFLIFALFVCAQESAKGSWVLLEMAYLLLHWHFAKQAFGVSLWLQKRDSYPSLYRDFSLAASLAIALQGFLESQSSPTVLNVFKSQMESFYWRSDFLEWSRWGMWALVGLFFAYAVFHILKKFSWIRVFSLLPVLSLILWFQYRHSSGAYLALIPVLHGLQYYPFVVKTMRDFKKSNILWIVPFVILILSSLLVFVGLPRALGAQSFEYLTGAGILFVFLNVHHFFVDAVLWKSRHSQVVHDGF